jgi:archaemetzincin
MAADGRIAGIGFLAVGSAPPELVRELAERVSRRVSVPCRVLPPGEPIDIPMLPGRAQADADRLLAAVEARAAAADGVVVGVTVADIAHPIFTHFFGRARHGGRAAIVSTARLGPDFYGLPADRERMLRRATLEAVHEVGHVAGLRHCEDPSCIMRFAPTVEAIDVRGTHPCTSCASALRGLLR